MVQLNFIHPISYLKKDNLTLTFTSDSVTVNETKCDMISFTDSIDKNIEMVGETTWYKNITLDVNHKCFDVNFKLDSGAEVNILPLYIFNMFKVKPKLSETNLSLTTYGEFPNEPCQITLKDNFVPVIHPPRRVPRALQPKLKSILNNLEKEGIVSKVNKPTDWRQSLVIVEKPNRNLRLCLDPRDLNKVIKREHYQIPCTDDIICRLQAVLIIWLLGDAHRLSGRQGEKQEIDFRPWNTNLALKGITNVQVESSFVVVSRKDRNIGELSM
ncbi:transposon Ty3-G Gag-Pol polyprotein [Nephila pilipes]|uniref:Transposon Ty3-G Gag-Pol polyprotein n=1 Tax=Nephila pilipes TaxID=299642 RepID=A0A8X6P607_NEPPI|nr:transposon Ty3-G Gag-Pol polyprotein [Nephila pilipes]